MTALTEAPVINRAVPAHTPAPAALNETATAPSHAPVQPPAPSPDPGKALDKDIERFVERLWTDKDVSLADCFVMAAETETYLRHVRNKTATRVSYDMPEVVEALLDKAKDGNVQAAKIALELVGFGERYGGQNNMIQINISEAERQSLAQDLED